ncbi:type I-E CRISPR-associated protein Cse2/CasB [Streptomyces sp. NPDC102278]|uniref:type I-E CRISPR-associated protein Cse2/CasB n=1 Tax=Streptomyces sp. NPDC102278 TaxID=3366152 RepID=UPI00382C004E
MTTIPVQATSPVPDRVAGRESQMSRFVAEVIGLCAQDKRAQADLRSGLGLPYERCHRLHRHLVRLVPRDVRHAAARRSYYAVAALIAARSRSAREEEAARAEDLAVQRKQARAAESAVEDSVASEAMPDPATGVDAERVWRERVSLGASLAEAVNKGLMKPDSAESELHYMARVGSDSLHMRLPALTRQLNGRGVVLDWAVLLDDLAWWDRHQDRIATRWLEDFFRVRMAEQSADSAASGLDRGESVADRDDEHNDVTPEENE